MTVLRAGIADTVPGRLLNVCERGIGAIVAGELAPGESVNVEVHLAPSVDPFRSKATVRFHDKLRCGLEFAEISAEQRSAIRDWTREAQAEKELAIPSATTGNQNGVAHYEISEGGSPNGGRLKTVKPRNRLWWIVALGVLVIAIALFWWRWSRGWEELESGLNNSKSGMSEKPTPVPTEAMQKLLIHRVEPIYPPEARKDNLQGIIALDVIVGRDGSVLSVRALNGPDALAQAASDALRWWKFEPYRLNGRPVLAETTVAVEFRP